MAYQPLAPLAQQENNGFGALSKPRGRAATIASVAVLLISWAIHVFAMKETMEGILVLLFTAALLALSLVLGEVVRRLCLVNEEIRHKHTRYEGNWKNVFKSTFAFGYRRGAAIASALLMMFCALYKYNEALSRPSYAVLFSLNCLVVPQLLFLVGFRQISPVETSELNERGNKNVADGLAWSYYFGYLKLVLPRLEGQISDSEQFRHKIKDKKVFILLPKTCYTFADIQEADFRVKWAGNLPEIKLNRGGIKPRSYKHSVHLIEMPRPDGDKDEYYFILEYATPLLSLYDMSNHAPASLSVQERDHQVKLVDIFLLMNVH